MEHVSVIHSQALTATGTSEFLIDGEAKQDFVLGFGCDLVKRMVIHFDRSLSCFL
jgi:hypothetical protein